MGRKRGRKGLGKRYKAAGSKLTHGRIRALLFPRSDWSIEDALLWAHFNGFNTEEYDVAENYIRIHPHGLEKRGKRVKVIPYGTNGMRAAVEWR